MIKNIIIILILSVFSGCAAGIRIDRTTESQSGGGETGLPGFPSGTLVDSTSSGIQILTSSTRNAYVNTSPTSLKVIARGSRYSLSDPLLEVGAVAVRRRTSE